MQNEKKANTAAAQKNEPYQALKIENRHKIILEQRAKATLTGVTDVNSFDEQTIITDTESGTLIIKGSSLHISNLNLNNGILELTGEINSFSYNTSGKFSKNKQSLMGRIFK